MDNWSEGSNVTLSWGEKKYTFCVEYVHTKAFKNDGSRLHYKQVVEGYFKGEAPDGLTPGTCYTLKRIWTQNNDGEHAKYAQSRERYDLIDYANGSRAHLRSILACCDNAVRIRDQLQNQNDCEDVECYSVEPIYTSLIESNEKIESMTAWERLEYIRQYAVGLKELQECAIGNKLIAAHRDVKIGNGLIERGDDSFVVKINDMSTICLGDASELRKYSGGTRIKKESGTHLFPLSPQNTAPEDVLSEEITERVDVYALGMMLAGFFGYVSEASGNKPYAYRNPNNALCRLCGKWDENDGEEIKTSLQKVFKEARAIDSPKVSWIEETLKNEKHPFLWESATKENYPLSGPLKKEIQELFISSTRIRPKDRIDLSGFIEQIFDIMTRVKEERNKSNYLLYRIPEAAYLFSQNLNESEKGKVHTALTHTVGRDGGVIDVFSYANSNVSRVVRPSDNCFTDVEELNSWMTKELTLPRAGSTNNGNTLLSALYNVSGFYRSNCGKKEFGGIVRIFTHKALTDEDFKPFCTDREQKNIVTVKKVLAELRKQVIPGHILQIFVHGEEISDFSGVGEDVFSYVPLVNGNIDKPTETPSAGNDKKFVTSKKGLVLMQDGNPYYVAQNN